jgi:uncharacterized C2H2 Zn-finger protein
LTTQPNSFSCPDCDHAPYTSRKGLATHRRYAHGVKGSAPSTIWMRKKKNAGRTTVMERLTGKFPCPKCAFVAQWKGGLTKHMRALHVEFRCPDCNKIFETSSGLGIHRRNTHGILGKHSQRREIVQSLQTQAIAHSNGQAHHHEETYFAANGIPEATLALALGRFQGLCTSMAAEFDIPPRLFASRFAELIYRSTGTVITLESRVFVLAAMNARRIISNRGTVGAGWHSTR